MESLGSVDDGQDLSAGRRTDDGKDQTGNEDDPEGDGQSEGATEHSGTEDQVEVDDELLQANDESDLPSKTDFLEPADTKEGTVGF